MTFKEFEYKRIDLDEIKKKIEELEEKFDNATSAKEQAEIYRKMDEMMQDISTMSNITYIRHTLNTNDEFYDKEQEFYNENSPILASYMTEFTKKMLDSKYRKELEEIFGKLLFDKLEIDLKTFDDKAISQLQEENKLCSEYIKITSSAKINFDNKVQNLSQLAAYLENSDRNIRKAAAKEIAKFYYENMEKLDEIYDKLVKVRDEIAKILGFNNFIELAYLRMGRLDYNVEDVKNYRKQIKETVVPVCKKLVKAQMQRINLDKLSIYDEAIKFLDGNPTPKGTKDELVNIALNMYKELSKETGEFFDIMVKKELMDLESKAGKQGGGYCTSLEKYKLPFIYANFNKTAGDVEVLTHEAGHAFQVYTTMQNVDISSYYWPSSESAEIHSMSMEFLTWPWMKDFFKEDTDKFKYNHLAGAIRFLPYGALVDEFQHKVFENPNLSPKQRRELWLELEKEYLPYKDYADIKEYKEGIFWFKQMHIFEIPFYYIDYTLAQVVAFQFWNLSRENKELAWEKYMKLCKLGGSKTFLRLLESVDMKNPFKDGTIKEIIKPIDEFLTKLEEKLK